MKMKKWIVSVLSVAVALAFTAAPTVTQPARAASPSKYTWSEKKAPNYVVKVGKAQVKNKPKAGRVKYSKLDKYGRTRTVIANVTYKMVKQSAGWRETIPESEDPAGWGHNRKVGIRMANGKIYHGYLYNRSHLLADSLGGSPIRENLVTGTRTQNVGDNTGDGGMAYTETLARNWLYSHHRGTIYYRATPNYRGTEKLPRSVTVDMKSSDGRLNMRVYVYNYAKGIKINYKTGSSSGSGAGSSRTATAKKKRTSSKTSASVYITATGKKYHSSKNCRGLNNARKIYRVSSSEAKSRGLTKCKLCW